MNQLGGLVLLSVKVPQSITHEKVLVDCDAELAEFLKTMDILGPELGQCFMASAWTARLCPGNSLRREAAQKVGAVSSAYGRNYSANRVR